MHSSGMRTARLLTVSQHILHRGCIPACTRQRSVSAQRGCTCPGGCLPGVYLPGGCTCPRGVVYLPGGVPAQECTCPGGLYLPGGCTCPGGVPAPGCVPAQGVSIPACIGADSPPLWTDKHLWKNNLRKLRLRAVKIDESNCKNIQPNVEVNVSSEELH